MTLYRVWICGLICVANLFLLGFVLLAGDSLHAVDAAPHNPAVSALKCTRALEQATDGNRVCIDGGWWNLDGPHPHVLTMSELDAANDIGTGPLRFECKQCLIDGDAGMVHLGVGKNLCLDGKCMKRVAVSKNLPAGHLIEPDGGSVWFIGDFRPNVDGFKDFGPAFEVGSCSTRYRSIFLANGDVVTCMDGGYVYHKSDGGVCR